MRNKIIEEAEEYILAFYEKRKLNVETNKTNNREKEKVNIELLYSTGWFYIDSGLLTIRKLVSSLSVILGQSREVP